MKTVFLAASVCCCMLASAADTHDYSTYVSLKKSLTLDVEEGGWPPATAWSDGCEMSDDKSYLVPAGMTLTSKTIGSGPIGGTWPGKELAIAGTFNATAGGNRTKVAVTPRMALLPGGKIGPLHSAYSTIRGDTLDIRGTEGNESLIDCSYKILEDKPIRYPLLDIAITGGSDAVLRLKYTTDNGEYRFQRAFRVTKGFAKFYGKVIVDGEYTWLRPHDENPTSFDVGGTMWVTNGAGLYIASLSPTFGSLVMAKDTTLRLYKERSLTVNGPCSIAAGMKIIVNKVADFKEDYNTASNSPMEIPVLSVCGAENAAAVDRDVLFNAIKAGSEDMLIEGGIPRLKLVVTDREDGGKDFKLSHDPFVIQTDGCASGIGPYGYGDHATHLSDGLEISPTNDYYTPNYSIYFDAPYVFPGRSWTVLMGSSRTFGFYSRDKLTVEDLRIIGTGGTSKFRMMSANINAYLYGNATIYGSVNFRVFGSGTFFLDSDLKGSGDIAVSLDYGKMVEKNGACRGRLSLGGDNSSFAGRFLVGCGRVADKSSGNEEAFTNLTLQATSSASLGGPIETFTFDAVKISDTCTLSVINDATFEAGNRGWCLMNGSTVAVAADKTVTMNGTVTFGGESVKTGEGTLVLGGPAKHYDSENDAAVDSAEGTSFKVMSGGFGAVSADALSGVALTFADGTKMVAVPETAGITLSEAPVIEGDALDVVIAHDGVSKTGTVNLFTLPSDVVFDTSKLSVKRIRGYKVSPVTEKTEGDTTVYSVTFVKLGLVIAIR